LAQWRTASLNGNYRLDLEVFGLSNPANFGAITNHTNMTLQLDNNALVAQILPLQAGTPDTPRIYTPGPPVPAGDPDLTSTLLGSFASNYGGGDPTCQILNLESPAEYLTFKLTAHHAGSYLRSWRFVYQRNDGTGEVLMGKDYNGTTNTMDDPPGVQLSSAEDSPSGFEDKFLYLDASHFGPGGSCAYRFVVQAATRTTDGYNYLSYAEDQDLHYLQK
jgi:hypothetical protein